MNASTVTLHATLQADGVTLQLDKKLSLPPGPVTVTVQHTCPRSGPTMLEVLDRIHHDQRQRGRIPMTEEEMTKEIIQARAEDDVYEQRWQQIWTQPGTSAESTENS